MKRPRPKWIILVSLIVAALIGVSLYCGFPPIRDAHLPAFAGIPGAEKVDYYNHSLGGFLDQEYLVRMDLHGSDPRLVFAALDIDATEEIPEQFWRRIPWYWPKSRRPKMDAYATRGFSVERVGDGLYFFAVHDRKKDRIYVWVKDNF